MSERNGILIMRAVDSKWKDNELIYISGPLNFKWNYWGNDDYKCGAELQIQIGGDLVPLIEITSDDLEAVNIAKLSTALTHEFWKAYEEDKYKAIIFDKDYIIKWFVKGLTECPFIMGKAHD